LKLQTLNDFNEILPAEVEANLQRVTTEELTPLERKVALLIRAGLPTKQIASVIYKSEAYLKNVRSNLRKKLILPENMSLKNFLCSL
jgi:DNA-binding NarL/FixJ family response regulator